MVTRRRLGLVLALLLPVAAQAFPTRPLGLLSANVDSPMVGNGSAGSHLRCPTCLTMATQTLTAGVIMRDAASPLATLFALQDNGGTNTYFTVDSTAQRLGALTNTTYFEVLPSIQQANMVGNQTVNINTAGTIQTKNFAADGAGFVGWQSETANTISSGKLQKWLNNTTEKANLLGSGTLSVPGVDALAAGALTLGSTTATSIALQQNVTQPTGKTLTVGANVLYGSVADKLNAANLAIASQAVGDLLIGATTSTFGRLADVATGQVLVSGGVSTAPAYSASPQVTALGANTTAPATGVATTSLRTTNLLISSTAPSVSSGFGTSPSISVNNGTASFRVTVGNPTGASGVVTLPAATTGWNCFCTDQTTRSTTVFTCLQTANTTTSATIGNFNTSAASANWVAGDVLLVSCFAN